MRISLKRSVMGLALACLVFSVTGCKSGFTVPGMSWLGWGSEPSATQLSSAPKKPSSGALPSPGMTTAPGSQRSGNTSFASSPYGTPNTGSSQYYTGPYRTGQTTPQGTSSRNGYPSTQNPSGLASTNTLGSRPATGYQSPYRSPASPATGAPGIRTADTRGGSFAAPNVTLPSRSTSPAGTAWQQNQPTAPANNFSNGTVAPAGYGNQAYPNAGQPSAPSQFATPAGASQAGLNQRLGPYRPGSTARATGILDAGRPVSPTGTQTPPSSPYGGYAYPTTGQ